MGSNTGGGSTASFGNTPQAKDDVFSSAQTGLSQSNLSIAYLNVMADDLGGNSKSLWSIDNGVNNTGAMSGYVAADLLTQDTSRVEATSADTSLHGAKIWITADGKVGYDASTLDAAFLTQGNQLESGQFLTDSFIYAIRLGNGTLSWATATVQIAVSGNHVAVIGNPTVHDVTEDQNVQAGNLIASGTISITDADQGQASFQTTVTGAVGNLGSLVLAANGSYTYSVDNSAVQFLGATDAKVDTFTVTSLDGTAKTVNFTIHGANDGAIIGGVTSGTVTEDSAGGGGSLNASGSLTIQDADAGQSVFAAQSGTAGSYGSFSVDGQGNWTYSTNNSQTAIQGLGAGQQLTEQFTVVSGDGSGQSVVITILGTNDAAILSSDVRNLTEGDTAAAISTSGTLTIDDIDSPAVFVAQSGIAGAYGSFSINAAGGWTYVASGAHNEFIAGTTHTDTFSVSSADGTQTSVTVNILGTNDAATISGTATGSVVEAGGVSNGTPGTPTVGGSLTVQDADSGQVFQTPPSLAGTYGSFTFNAATGAWGYTLNNGAANVQALTATSVVHDILTVNSLDGSASRAIDVTIQGSNDAPTVTGPSTGSVTEDQSSALQTRGTLVLSDPDGGAPAWSIVGGVTTAQTQDFRFQLDNLKVVRNNVTNPAFFEDTFGDGVAPPSGAVFSSTTGVNSSAYATNGILTEAAGRAFFDGTQSVAFGTSAYGERALLNSDISESTVAGLKKNMDFTAEARFDLITPEDVGDAYGIRLTDQSSAPPNNNGTAELVVLRDATGVHVVLRQIAINGGTNVVLEKIDITPAAQTQIVLRLSYDHTSYGGSAAGGGATAAFDIVSAGVVISTTPFTNQATIFQGEDFTQLQVVGQTGQTETGVYKLAGTYGTLTMAQDGQWHYFLADQQANVQALTQGQQVTDTFTVRVSDGLGGLTDKQVVVTVNGVNDAAIIGNPTVSDVTEDINVNGAGNLTATGVLSITDVDAGQSAFQTVVAPSVGTLGNLALAANGSYTYSVANSAVQFLGANAVKLESFTVRSVDGTSKVVNFQVHGVNDAPVAQPDGGNVVEAGTLLNSDQVTVGFSAASGNVLLNDSDPDNDFVSVSGLAVGTTNVPLSGNIFNAVTGTYGALTMFSNGAWGYQLDNANPLTNALTGGQAVTDVFTYTVIDGHGGTANQTITINVTGTNDAPVATPLKLQVLEGSGSHQLDLLAGTIDAEGNQISVANVNLIGGMSLDADGHTLTVDTNAPIFNSVAMGQHIDLNFGYDLVDSRGSVRHEFGTFRLVGADDAPSVFVIAGDALIEAGGNNAGRSNAGATILYDDPDIIGPGPGGTLLHQFVTLAPAGWTANENGSYSKAGLYGTATWNYAVLGYHLDNNNPNTIALETGDRVYDTFSVPYTDGTLTTTATIAFEIDGRSDMNGESLLYKYLWPTESGSVLDSYVEFPEVRAATGGTELSGITPDEVLNYGNIQEIIFGANGTVDFGRNDITFTFAQNWFAPAGYTDIYLSSVDGSVHHENPGSNPFVQWFHYNDPVPFNGVKISGLPTIESVQPTGANVGLRWDAHDIWIDFQNRSYAANDEVNLEVTFAATPSLNAPASNTPWVDVGANTQSIGPLVTVYDGFTFDLNVAYSGTVAFQGTTGVLKLEQPNFSGTVTGFLTNADKFDFSAFTQGNATVTGAMAGSTLDAHSIGWITSGADTTVYVNVSDFAETVMPGPGYSADMAVHVQNVAQLHPYDFIV